MNCPNPEHPDGPGEVCAGCYAEAEAEVTRLRDQLQRMTNDQRDHAKRTEAAAARSAHDHMVTWAGLYYLKPALAQLTFPLEEALGRAANLDPAWGRTKDARARLETLKVTAGQAQRRWWEIQDGAEPAWRADPREAEAERLRKVITGHAEALHLRYAPPSGGFTACGCPGCTLIRSMDEGVL